MIGYGKSVYGQDSAIIHSLSTGVEDGVDVVDQVDSNGRRNTLYWCERF